ncbi:MAG: phosphoribosylamine--glycine ligase [Bacteroidetes bacterium]|nr:phosphoribosylamine--glycine ligase [Bacteroidota bacterium]
MNILIIGAGGREHTLAWKIAQSPLCTSLFIAPGNAGSAQCGTNLPIAVTDFEKITQACLQHKIDLVVVGPEDPLVKGIVDYLKAQKTFEKMLIIGPSQTAAQLEGSKAFAKRFMMDYNIPTAAFRKFSIETYDDGVEYIKQHSLPIVLKADGLAAGKGVVICQSQVEALAEFDLMLHRSKFGDAGKTVVIEEFLEGLEMSVFFLTDGKNYVLLPEAKDYKRIGQKDTGLNTGGMGAVSPVPGFDAALKEKVIKQIIEPTLKGLQNEKLEYKGFVFLGLMISQGNPYMIEYNCRMGDPETEVVIPRIKNDLVSILMATAKQELDKLQIETDERTAVTVVAASGGYPGNFEAGKLIEGLKDAFVNDSIIFHAGTEEKNGKVFSRGGRVLAVTSFGNNIVDAAEHSNYLLEQVNFEGMYFRKDIGYEFK